MTLSALGIFSAAGAGGGVSLSDFELIQTVIVSGSSTTSVVFDVSGLGSTYKHLQLRAVDRQSTAAVEAPNGYISFNGATANHVSHLIYGSGSAVASIFDSGRIAAYGLAASATSGNFTARVIDILDAFSTTKNKTLRMLQGNSEPTNQRIILESGLWISTSATTSVSMVASSPSTWVAGTRFSIYGIR
jgi:hypothetical protein